MTDKERIDWLEGQYGFALISDDNRHWACVSDGTQNVPIGDDAQDIASTYFIEKHQWKSSIREAIDFYRKQQQD